MPALSAKDSWLLALILLSIGGFLAAWRWGARMSEGCAIAFSVGFSLMFTVLTLGVGLIVLR